MAYKHGVYIQENATKHVSPAVSESAIQFVVGTAPINLLDNPKDAVNKLILVNDLSEAKASLGYSDSFDKFTICQCVDASFNLFNVSPLVIVNVLDPDVHISAVSETLHTLVNKEIEVQEEGILLDENFVVKDSTNTTTYTKNTDYTLEFTEGGFVLLKILDNGTIGDGASQLSLSYNQLDPTAVTDADIIGSYNSSTGVYTGLEMIEQVYPVLAKTIGLINIPGWSHKPTIASAMIAKTENISSLFKCECLLDIDTTEVNLYSLAATWKIQNEYTSKHCIPLWPMVKVGDKKYYYSAVYGALAAYVDSINDGVPYVSPSNKSVKIDACVLADDSEVYLDLSKANELNSNGIVTAINLNGWKCWGNNTGAYPESTDPKDRFIPVRRMFDWWGNDFIKTYLSKVDDPLNYRLIETIVDNENIKANGFKSRFQIADAKIEFIQDQNPTSDLLDGVIRFNQALTPYPPARAIINTLEFDSNALASAIGGGQ